jgi:hypothetical protein
MILATALALMQASPPAADAFMTGEHLYVECRDQIPLTCVTYILGVSDALRDAVALGAPRLLCPGPQVEQEALLQAVIAYLRDHPDRRPGRASELVIAALRESFPCPPGPAR